MASPVGSVSFVGYSSTSANGILIRVLEPVLAGDLLTVRDDSAAALNGGKPASWTWTADRDIPAGTTLAVEGLAAGEAPSEQQDVETTGSIGGSRASLGSSTNPGLFDSATNAFIDPSIELAPPAATTTPLARVAGPGDVGGVSARGFGGGDDAVSSLQAEPDPAIEQDAPAQPQQAAPTMEAAPAQSQAATGPVFTEGDDSFTNEDLLLDGVFMLGGNDTLINAGTIIGRDGVAIDTAAGNDQVTLLEDSQLFGSIRLGAGDDRLTATETGQDLVVDAGEGNDIVLAGAGDDLLQGGAGDDLLDGAEGDDALQGGDGNDRLVGGLGDDFLLGGAGNDALVGGEGNDLIQGGDGVDTLDYASETAAVSVDLGAGRASGDGIGSDTVSGVENVIGGSGNDVLAGDGLANVLDGGAGDDRILAAAGDTALGGAGDDTIEVRAGGSAPAGIDGGAGRDTVELTGTGAGSLAATSAVERLDVKGGSWSVAGSAAYGEIAIRNGATVTSGLIIDNDDRVAIDAGGTLRVATNTVTWAGGGAAVLTNAGLISVEGTGRLLQATANAIGSLKIDNLTGGVLRGVIEPSRAGAADAGITLNNAGLIEANGRVIDFQDFDDNGASATINNLAGGVIRQFGTNTDVIRPGQNGTVNNAGTIMSELGAVAGGDLIDFQGDRGGRVNNFAGGRLDGAKHAVTGEQAVTVVNQGTMIGRNGSAVNIDNDGSEASRVSITNSGIMEGRSAGLDNSDGDAIDIDGLLTLTNSGTIEGLGANGSNNGEPNVSEGIAIGGGSILNTATGRIYGYGRAIQVDNSGNANALGATRVVNDGLIQGDGNGPEGVTPEAAAAFDLRGNEAINLIGDYADEIINTSSGRILGGVAMGGGNDKLGNSGLITATGGAAVDMGAGDDSVNLFVGASVIGKILLGAGNDLVTSTSSSGFEIDGGEGDDQIYLGAGADFVLGGVGKDIIYTGAGDDEIDGGAGNDLIDGGAGDDAVFGGAGDDTIKASAGADTIDGGAGFDTLDLTVATGPVFVDMAGGRISGGGIGIESFTSIENLLFGDGDNTVTGGNGDDAFDGGAGNDTLNGGAGDDIVVGGLGNDAVFGGSGDDELDGGVGNDVLAGGSGDDILLGGVGDDTLSGGSGDDEIEGGIGDDLLTGGSGTDTFHFAAGFGRDAITDFGVSDPDIISFEDDLFADFGAVISASAQVGGDVVITIDAQTALTLRETSLGSLTADDFRFA